MSDDGYFVGPYGEPDRYALAGPVGAGSEGVLYRAAMTLPSGTVLDVAVKMLHPQHRARIEVWRRRWLEQIELLRSLQAPGLVRVRDGFIGPPPHAKGQGRNEDTLYLVMNWVDGVPLDAWNQTRDDLPLDRLKILLPVAGALDLMHSGHGTGGTPVVHGDVKPANILVRASGESILVDPGLLRSVPHGHRTTGVSGTLGYLAPEVRTVGRISPASDRYALGAVAYFLLTGKDPPDDNDLQVFADGIAETHPDDDDLVEHVLRMLDPEPDERPRILANWCAQLRGSSLEAHHTPELLPPLAPTAPADASLGQLLTRRRPRRALASVCAVVALLVAATSGDGGSRSADPTSLVAIDTEPGTTTTSPPTATTSTAAVAIKDPAVTAAAVIIDDGDAEVLGTTRCRNTFVGYQIEYPADWHERPESSLVAPCEAISSTDRPALLDPYGTLDDEIVITRVEMPMSRVLDEHAHNEHRRTATSVAGHNAVVVEHRRTMGGAAYTYLVDLGDATLAVQTAAPRSADPAYAGRRALVDSVVATLRFEPTACQDRTDQRCGAFRWNPEPTNQPATSTIEFTPSQPRVGETVTFTVTVTDPDADTLEIYAHDFGDESVAADVDGRVVAQPGDIYNTVRSRVTQSFGAFGPWTPPPVRPGQQSFTFTHVYERVGDFRARFDFRSSNSATRYPSPDPYGETGSGTSEPVPVR